MTVVGTTTTTLMSFAEFERIDQGADQIELLRGELIRVPPPQRNHMEICHQLYDMLKAAIDLLRKTQPNLNLGKVYIEMGYLLSSDPRSWLQPDVSLTHPLEPGDRYYEGAPLMVFEIVSEYDAARHLEAKVAEYLAHGAAEVWVLYPDSRHARVYDRSSPVARGETRSIHSELLPGIEIPFDAIL
ncbi:MAG TPA: Uma2 family endonuclease [Candidatus Acidoferrales bacterium]|jgi:Uma2 family endonuclease|nr:Uma2 family endonuclease [Candidatus Acidoferrales bacterium]